MKVLINPSLAEHDMPCLKKEANWTGSALFVMKYVNFYQKPGSSNLIGWKLEVDVASIYSAWQGLNFVNAHVKAQHDW